MSKQTTYGNIKNGDQVWIQGHLFTVSDLHTETVHGLSGVIRFTGTLPESDDLFHTPYNGGQYGGIISLPCTIE